MASVTRQGFRAGTSTFVDSVSPVADYGVVFEDDGEVGYFYALDLGAKSNQILDAVHIYNVDSVVDPDRESQLEIQWSNDGTKSALLINGFIHAVFDFATRRGYCRTNYPNFGGDPSKRWTSDTHEWDESITVFFS